MATSGAGFGASGFLQGFAQSYNAARIRATQQDLDQRHQMASTLSQLYQNARPEAQADIAQRILQIYSTPPGKKIDKKIGDITTLGRNAAQQNLGAQAGGQQASAEAGPAAGLAPPPSASPSPTPGGAPVVPPTAPSGGGLMAPRIPPPPDLAQPSAGYSPILSPTERNAQAAAAIRATEGAKMTAELDARRAAAEQAGLQPGTPAYENFVAGRIVAPLAHYQTKYIVGPNGERQQVQFNPLTGETVDAEGNIIENPIGWTPAVNAPGTSAYKTFYAAHKSNGETDEEISNAWNTTHSAQQGYRMVTQPDGTTVMVPVTTTTTQTRGGIPAPPGTGSPSIGQGTVVGGKVIPEVAKAQTAYQDSITRFNVMSEALPQALAGNQQAMINLLYNHIGMTVGLQRGARISQEVIDEAQKSAPWMASLLARIGIGNGFEMTPELMRGVVLTPDQMHQMVDLAEGRVEQDYRKFQAERDFYSKGAGAVQTPESVVAGGRTAQKSKPGTKVPPPPSSGGTVKMRAPNGQVKPVPADQVEHYKSLGATVVQ